ncbi:glycoside hydrolase family 99-like domain-containing protein [Rheinheimera sp. UJ51]|uniref:glycosyltransferase WbsX family protein n=1 Tax=Rheinheimera sp. UJ51 TaxID=2892446 RepID=UPI001E4A0281|nr:glycoside hydrolase family 99-like domain-containing protein [Rheinheimera sp. UJ51]MCC5450494.1 glycoside hydrolase family 99-like domain-containing protein [Rheinheimera sp. UJ51]
MLSPKKNNFQVAALQFSARLIKLAKEHTNAFAVYGAGDIGKHLTEFLMLLDCKPSLIVDKNHKKIAYCNEVQVSSPETLISSNITLVFIASFAYEEEIRDYLERNLVGVVILALSEENNLVVNSALEDGLYTKFHRQMSERSRKYGPNFVNYHQKNISLEQRERVKNIALYLPQFHKVKENDEWWGNNFTEWQSVTRAVPQYYGQYQPHLPVDTGFYDLMNPKVLKEQALLAKNYGIYGFCFYFYWFNGRRILETPLNNLLNDKSIDIPFCLFWANDSWSRTWHGFSELDKNEKKILIEQSHSYADSIELMNYLCLEVFSDSRYIKVNNKPLFTVYHTDAFDSLSETAQVWQQIAKKFGFDGLLLIHVQRDHQVNMNPHDIGFDSAMQFSPLGCYKEPVSVEMLNPDFQGNVFSYKDLIEKELDRTFTFPIIRGAFMSWDNEARRPTKGVSYQGSSPELFKKYLSQMNKFASENRVDGDAIVFINAWNEWAEGAHLEADREYGYAWLDIVSKVVLSNK